MALLEQLQRKAEQHGLIPKLVKLLPRISILLSITGLIWLLTLPMQGNYRHTYISENALMPSQAYNFFRESEWNFLRGYRDEIVTNIDAGSSLIEKNQLLQNWLDEIGYQTSVLNYTSKINGENKPILYAIYHAPKGDDTEALVLAVPWKTEDNEYNKGGVGLGMGLARYFYRLSIWSKNIIIVFPENAQDSLKYWVDSYHTNLDQTGGSIEAATILEYPSGGDGVDYVEISYVGLNGQLPNLDLINCAAMISEHEGFKVSLHNTPKGQLWADDYSYRLTTLLKGVFEMATAGILKNENNGGGNGCEAFSGWNIQTFAIKARGTEGLDITTVGRVIEAVFRSVNNLLEKFHQSFFFYLLLTPKHFVSIGNYLPAGVLTAFAFAIASLSSILGNNNLNNNGKKFDISKLKIDSKILIWGFITITIILTATLTFGWILIKLTSSIPFIESSIPFYTALTYVICFSSIVLSLLPILISIKFDLNYIRFTNSFSLFYLAYTLIALLVLHFSLSFMISLCCIPLTLIKYGANSKQIRIRNSIMLSLSNPFNWLLVLGYFNTLEFQLDRIRNLIQYFEFNLLVTELTNLVHHIGRYSFQEQYLGPVETLYGIISTFERFGNWIWLVVVISWLPVWVCSVIVCFADVDDSEFANDEQKQQQTQVVDNVKEDTTGTANDNEKDEYFL